MNNEPPPKEEKLTQYVQIIHPSLQVLILTIFRIGLRTTPGQSRLIEAEEEDYFNGDDDDDIIPPIAAPLFPRGQAPSPPLNSLKRKRRAGLNITPGFRPTLTPPRTPPIGNLVDYGDDDEEIPLADLDADMEAMLGSAPAFDSSNVLSSPRMQNRQVQPPVPPRRPSPGDDEDDLLESLVRSKDSTPSQPISTPTTPDLTGGPPKPSEKRRRDDNDDDDELLERLASKSKRPDLGADKVLSGAMTHAGTKQGDDPPKKIKLKFGLSSLGAAPSPTSSDTSSESGVKDGDTG